MTIILFTAFGLALLTYFLSDLYRRAALLLQIVDTPGYRHAHRSETATGGGVVFILMFVLTIFISNEKSLDSEGFEVLLLALPGLVLVALVGFVDDIWPLDWRYRLFAHTAASGYVLYALGIDVLGVEDPESQLRLLTNLSAVFGLVWLLNLYNFMDGIDGIAGTETVFVLSSASMIAWINFGFVDVFLLFFLSILVGWLVINLPVARLFMGDAGSGFLGLLIGVVILSELHVSLCTYLILLAWFVVDASLTLATRLIRGQRFQDPHSQHAYQHLNRALGTWRTLMVVQLVNFLWLLPLAICAMKNPGIEIYLLIFTILIMLPVFHWMGAGLESPRILALRVS